MALVPLFANLGGRFDIHLFFLSRAICSCLTNGRRSTSFAIGDLAQSRQNEWQQNDLGFALQKGNNFNARAHRVLQATNPEPFVELKRYFCFAFVFLFFFFFFFLRPFLFPIVLGYFVSVLVTFHFPPPKDSTRNPSTRPDGLPVFERCRQSTALILEAASGSPPPVRYPVVSRFRPSNGPPPPPPLSPPLHCVQTRCRRGRCHISGRSDPTS